MPRTVRLQYIAKVPSPALVLHLNDGAGAIVETGQVLDVPVELAGRAPSDWRPVAKGDPEHWPTRFVDAVVDGETVQQLETFDPGEGFLAQHDNWALVTANPAKGDQATPPAPTSEA